MCLRLTTDDELFWSQHIKLTRPSFHTKVKMLRRISFLAKSILETIYFKTVIPSVFHGIVIWGFGTKLKELEMIHGGAARLIDKLPKCVKGDDILASMYFLLSIFRRVLIFVEQRSTFPE